MLVSPVNISEGRRPEAVRAIAGAAGQSCHLLDVHSDPDHNRSVLTLAGEPEALVEGVVRAARRALRLIDLNHQTGVHPRLGAIDVVPFFPAPGKPGDGPSSQTYVDQMHEAVSASLDCARRLWDELALPCFLYGYSSRSGASAGSGPRNEDGVEDEPLPLPAVRRTAFKSLEPDFGGPGAHPTAGATVVGARDVLVAYNMKLESDDLRIAREIAAALRKGGRGLDFVRALGVPLPTRGLVQVSCNLLKPHITTIPDVFEAASAMASALGVELLESEVAGLTPAAALKGRNTASLRFAIEPKILEDCLRSVPE